MNANNILSASENRKAWQKQWQPETEYARDLTLH